MHETFWSLLHDAAHWEFELFLMAVFDGVIGCLLWPFVRKHWQHHKRHDIADSLNDITNAAVRKAMARKANEDRVYGHGLPDGYCDMCSTPGHPVIHEALKKSPRPYAHQSDVMTEAKNTFSRTSPSNGEPIPLYDDTVAELWTAAGLEKPEERMGTCDVASISHRQHGWCKNWKSNRSR